MKTPKIMLIIFVSVLSAGSAIGANFTLSDDGLMALDWHHGYDNATLTNRINILGPGVLFYIHFPGNEQPESVFQLLSSEYGGAGLLTGLDVSMYDEFELKFTIVSINGVSTPDVGGLISVGSVIGQYGGSTSAYRPAWIDLVSGTTYDSTAISSISVKTDVTSILGILVWLFDPSDWNPSGTNLTLLVEAVPGAVALPDLPKIYYVDEGTAVDGDGSCWEMAFRRLQDALAVAKSGDEIRVAQGVYRPAGYVPPPPPPPPPFGSSNEDESLGPAVDRTATFQLKNGVVIKGGYAGFGEPDPNARDIKLYKTILSGDIVGNDEPNFVNYEENSYHVVIGSGTNETAILDGFTITGGNANGVDPDNNGAGMINYSGSPTLTNCTFSGNLAGGDGGGMFNWDSSPTLTKCTFSGNSAHKGGGMHNRQYSDPRVTNCTFIANSAGGEGGGMRNKESGPTVTNCTFSGNSSGYVGGGIQNALNSSSLLVDCIFSGNWAERAGGGLSNFSTSSTTVTNCTFIGNSAGEVGGGMHNNRSSNPTVTNCTFSGNLASDNGGGMYNQASSPTLTNCTFSGNSTMKAGGGMHNNESNPTLTNCSFTENSAARAGGMRNRINSSPTLINCTFIGNLASENAGGMGNRNIGRPTLINCTFSGNRAEIQGGGVFNDSSSISTLANCILWGNTAPIGPQMDNDGTSWAIVSYSDVQGGWPGEGNIDADPCFVEPEYFGPIAYWKLDEAGGTTAYDSVGQNHGTVYGAQWTSGLVGSALDFDGMDDYKDDYVDVPDFPDLNSQLFTAEAWIKTSTTSFYGTFGTILVKGRVFNENYGLYVYQSGWVRWQYTSGGVWGDTTKYVFLDSSKVVNDGQFHHIVGTYDGEELKIYIDGSLDSSRAETKVPDKNNVSLRIGRRNNPGDVPLYSAVPFDGIIDEVAIYDRALSDDEVRQHYFSGLNGQGYPDLNTPDYHLLQTSACINAAANNCLFADTQDLDGDGDTTEPIPFDLDGNPRVVYDVVDMGPYEFCNATPIADAGPDQVVECACNTEEGTKVLLDGTNSSDPDRGVLTYIWTGPFVESPAHGATPLITLEDGCPGDYVITLVVNDGIEDSEPNEVLVTVVDVTKPEFEFSVTPTMLWPPNHKMVEITPSWTVSDECDASPDVSLLSIVANEGDGIIGDGHTSNDIQIDDYGSIFVRSERSGTDTGRIYTITYQAVDDCGNTMVRSATVSIPHDFKILARIASRWLWTGPVGGIPEDLNGDGILNLKDIAIFANNWTQ